VFCPRNSRDRSLGRCASLFSGGHGFNPLGLGKAPFPYLQPDTTFIASHNGCELKPILEMCPMAFSKYLLLGLFPLARSPADPPAWLSIPNRPRRRRPRRFFDRRWRWEETLQGRFLGALRRPGSFIEEIEDEHEDEWIEDPVRLRPKRGIRGGQGKMR
jgi:hypothetical protein